MRPLVRDLYKKLMTVGRDYPAGLEHVRVRAKREFRKRGDLSDEVEIKKSIAYGRYMLREMMGVIQLKKYRTLKAHLGASAFDRACFARDCPTHVGALRDALRGDRHCDRAAVVGLGRRLGAEAVTRPSRVVRAESWAPAAGA